MICINLNILRQNARGPSALWSLSSGQPNLPTDRGCWQLQITRVHQALYQLSSIPHPFSVPPPPLNQVEIHEIKITPKNLMNHTCDCTVSISRRRLHLPSKLCFLFSSFYPDSADSLLSGLCVAQEAASKFSRHRFKFLSPHVINFACLNCVFRKLST